MKNLFIVLFAILSNCQIVYACASFGVKRNAIAPAIVVNPVIGFDLPLYDADTEIEDNKPQENLCIACFEREAQICNMGCGHLAFCNSCYEIQRALKMRERAALLCPVCRDRIEDIAYLREPYGTSRFNCGIPNCLHKAIVYHDVCKKLILCMRCADKAANARRNSLDEGKIDFCLSCHKSNGLLHKIVLTHERDDSPPPDFPEPGTLHEEHDFTHGGEYQKNSDLDYYIDSDFDETSSDEDI